jgi:hypothetical protein
MSYKVSTGLRNQMLVTSSLKTALASGLINVYSGAAPASADDAVSGVLLWTISLNNTGSGIDLDATATNGVVGKPTGSVWSGTVVTSGTAGYYRHVGSSDSGASSTTQPRIQGAVGVIGAEMNLSNPILTSGSLKVLDNYTIELPTA